MAAKVYPCGWCGTELATSTAHAIHVTNCPDRPDDPRAGVGTVTCPACASDIPIRQTRECPGCGRQYVGRMGVG